MALVDQEFADPRQLRDAVHRELLRRDSSPLFPVGRPTRIIRSEKYKASFDECVRALGNVGAEIYLPPITMNDIGRSVCVMQINNSGTVAVYAAPNTTVVGLASFATTGYRMRRVIAATTELWCLEF